MGQFQSTQNIPPPDITEENLPDQSGKVHIVTGGYAECGQELVKILYQRNACVYVAGRNEDKARKSIGKIKEQFSDSKGRLEFLQIDLSDLASIKRAANKLMARETRLDVLTNNAGVLRPPAGSKDAQGHELQLSTNCLGPFLFSELLVPILRRTAASSPPGSVRVTWAGSLAVVLFSPENGVELDIKGAPTVHENIQTNYGHSKAGNFFLGVEFTRRYGKDGIVSVSWNPGNLKTEMGRHANILRKTLTQLMLYPAVYGAYTELYAGWPPDITLDNNGAYIIPWGRIATDDLRPDLLMALKAKKDRGSGVAGQFGDWCDKETRNFR